MSSVSVAENLKTILARIETARKKAVRPAPFTRLVAVTKTHGPERIRPALAAGHRLFGENRVQEAQRKWPALRSEFAGIELHLIGPLQTNKTKDALALFDAIHSVDRPSLVESLAKEMARGGKRPVLFIQVNTGEEPQKAGVFPEEAAPFIAMARSALGDAVQGLMCIPPVDEEPSPHFGLLKKLADENGLPLLSMGMSDDFETAIRFGATHVRIGTAIFGAREAQF